MVTQTQVSCLIFLFYLESQNAVSGHFGYTRNLIPFSKKKNNKNSGESGRFLKMFFRSLITSSTLLLIHCYLLLVIQSVYQLVRQPNENSNAVGSYK